MRADAGGHFAAEFPVFDSYSVFLQSYTYYGIYSYENIDATGNVELVQLANANSGETVYLNYYDPKLRKELQYGKAAFILDNGGSGNSDAFTWTLSPADIGAGKSKSIFFRFESGPYKIVYFEMRADVEKNNSVSVTGVSLDYSSLSMTVGDTQTLIATVGPSNATNKNVTWSSNNTSVATVSSSGVVTAKAAGNATITVKTNDGEKTATCKVTVKAKESPITGLLGDYTISSVTIAEDDEGLFYSNCTWEMAITPDEGSSSRIWIDKIVPLFSKEVAANYFSHGEVYAEVSEDMKTITIPVPQEVKSTAAPFGAEYDEPLVLYKCAGNDATSSYETSEGAITFTLQEDGSWKTIDSYGFTIASYVKEGLFSSYMNCYGGFNPNYPTYFIKNSSSGQQAKLMPPPKTNFKPRFSFRTK